MFSVAFIPLIKIVWKKNICHFGFLGILHEIPFQMKTFFFAKRIILSIENGRRKKVEQCAALESINSQRKYYFFHPTNCTVLFWAFSCVWFFCFVWENSLTSLCAEKKTYFFCVIRSLFVSTKLNSEINPHLCILSLLFVASLQIAR